jgi:hypothetical protein
MDIVLDPGQLAILGVVASVLTAGLRLLANRFGYNAPREVSVGVVFLTSIGLSIYWFGLPAFANGSGDPMELAQSLLAAATTVFGSAVGIYLLLLNRVVKDPE